MGYALEAGRYRFTIFEGFADGTKRALATLPLHVLDPAASDPRTPAAIAVEKLEAYLSGDRALETRKYSIAGASGGARALERHSLEELRALLEYWRRRLAVEEANAAGRGIIRHIRQRI
jgi:hypothetical protein